MSRQLLIPALLLLWGSSATAQVGYSVVNSNPDQLFSIPLAGGSPVPVGTLPVEDVFGLAFDGSGTLYGVSAETDELIVIDPNSAQVASVGPLGFDVSIAGGLTFDPGGNLWLVSDNDVYSVDAQDGQATFLGNLSAAEEVWGLSACGDQLTAVWEGPSLEVGLAVVDTSALTLEITSEHSSWPPAGLDWHQGEVFVVENRYSPILPPPMTVGSFLLRLSAMGSLLDYRWLMYPESLAFAIGPPASDCLPVAAVEVPSLSGVGAVALVALLGICAVVTLSRRTAPA